MNTPSAVDLARAKVLSEFHWHDGHADVWRLFANAATFASLIEGLAEPWRDAGISHVVGIESRGFLLGGAVAVSLGVGFQAIRKQDGLLPGAKISAETELDYRSRRNLLRMQATLVEEDVVLLVDDWAERGSQAMTARDLVESCGARFAGVSVVVDQLDDATRAKLGRVTSLVVASDLGRSDA